MKRWIERILVALAIAFAALYGGDWALWHLRGTPQKKITVNRVIEVPLKGNRQEFDDQGTVELSCTESLFPQAGLAPCWRVPRNQNEKIS